MRSPPLDPSRAREGEVDFYFSLKKRRKGYGSVRVDCPIGSTVRVDQTEASTQTPEPKNEEPPGLLVPRRGKSILIFSSR
jgi:hypothetical protein